MVRRNWNVSALVLLSASTVACGGSASPAAPSAPASFLAGTWNGTLTIEREGEPTMSGPVSWTFEVVSDTNLQTFRTTIRSQHAWLPITTTVTTALTPGNTPPAR